MGGRKEPWHSGRRLVSDHSLLSTLVTMDGESSGIDADKLDGHSSDYFAVAGHTHESLDLPLVTLLGDEGERFGVLAKVGELPVGDFGFEGTSRDFVVRTCTLGESSYLERFRVKNSSGYIGVGTDNPQALWHLKGSGSPVLVAQSDSAVAAVVFAVQDKDGFSNFRVYSDGSFIAKDGVSSSDYALVTQLISDGDLTHSPSGDAVYNALALKAPTESPTFTGTATIPMLIVPIIKPASDSTTAIQLTKADGTTPVATLDTTNNYVGVGTTTPAFQLDIAGPTRIRESNAVKFGGTGTADVSFEMAYNATTNSLDFNYVGA